MDWYDEAMFDMTGSELRSTMNAKAMAESRQGELVRAFLIDLEQEYSTEHRIAFQATWAVDAAPRGIPELAHELDLPRHKVSRLIDDGLMYARKWFGAEGVAGAAGVLPMRQAA